MFWTKILLANLGLFVIWAKIFFYLAKHWSINDHLLLQDKFLIDGKLEEFNISYSYLKGINLKLNPILDAIRKSSFFRIFKVNFDSECNFWTQNMICNFSTCTICQCDEKEIPFPWKQDSLGDTVNKEVKDNFFNTIVEKYNYTSPQWLVESEIDNQNGIFVNLLNNPETWTGYQGQKIWEAIYMENCFRKHVDDLCLEEKLFYRIVSGLHSNINLHLSQNFLDIEIEKSKENEQLNSNHELSYYTNITMAYDRVIAHPARVNNLFYLYSLVLTTLHKAEKTLVNYEYETGNIEENKLINKNITEFYNIFNSHPNIFPVQKLNENNEYLKKFFEYNKIDEIKMRFRNISSIIDCVGCQKCKLHGKLQIYGLATMLKILFDKNEIVNLKRNELIAFVNLASKIHRSVGYMLSMKENIDIEVNMYRMKCWISIAAYILIILGFNYYYLYVHKRDNKKRSQKSKPKRKISTPKTSDSQATFVMSSTFEDKIKKE